MIWVKEKCWKCGDILTDWIPNYKVIDIPYIVCPKCNSVNDRSAKATEWFLMTNGRKLSHILLTLYWSIGYALVLWILPYGMGLTLSDNFLVSWLIISFLITAGFNFLHLYRKIQKSMDRKNDTRYYELLKKIGYVDKSKYF